MASSKINWQSVRKSLQKYIAKLPEFRRRFEQAHSRRAKLRRETAASVKRWEWYTAENLELEPTRFLFAFHAYDEKPGRLLKRDPMFKVETVRYGFDDAGRVVLRHAWAVSEEFREYRPGRVDAARFHEHTGNTLSVQTLFLDGPRPLAHVIYDRNGMAVRRYEHSGGKLVKVLETQRRHPEKFGGTPQWTCTAVRRLIYDRFGLAKVLTDDEERQRTVVERIRRLTSPESKTPELDLRKDVDELKRRLKDAVKQFAKRKKCSPVSGIGFGFRYYDNPEPEVYLHFDVRPQHKPDGVWTHEFFRTFRRPAWGDFWSACAEGNGRGILIDVRGKRHRVSCADDNNVEPAPWFGQMLAEVLKQARRESVFQPLQAAAECVLGVDDEGDGAFACQVE